MMWEIRLLITRVPINWQLNAVAFKMPTFHTCTSQEVALGVKIGEFRVLDSQIMWEFQYLRSGQVINMWTRKRSPSLNFLFTTCGQLWAWPRADIRSQRASHSRSVATPTTELAPSHGYSSLLQSQSGSAVSWTCFRSSWTTICVAAAVARIKCNHCVWLLGIALIFPHSEFVSEWDETDYSEKLQASAVIAQTHIDPRGFAHTQCQS